MRRNINILYNINLIILFAMKIINILYNINLIILFAMKITIRMNRVDKVRDGYFFSLISCHQIVLILIF